MDKMPPHYKAITVPVVGALFQDPTPIFGGSGAPPFESPTSPCCENVSFSATSTALSSRGYAWSCHLYHPLVHP